MKLHISEKDKVANGGEVLGRVGEERSVGYHQETEEKSVVTLYAPCLLYTSIEFCQS